MSVPKKAAGPQERMRSIIQCRLLNRAELVQDERLNNRPLTCLHCGFAFFVAAVRAGTEVSCERCEAVLRVPLLSVACNQCNVPSMFAGAMLGQSGPCRSCGALLTVTLGQAAAQPVPPQHQQQPVPHAGQNKALYDLQREVAEIGGRVLGSKLIQVGVSVSRSETGQALLKASIPFARGELRTDIVQGIMVSAWGAEFIVVIPWSGQMMLPHEFGAVLPGALPTILLRRRTFLDGVFSGSYGGEQDPIAVAADQESDLSKGITWDAIDGRRTIKLQWGLQVVPLSPHQSLHVAHTGSQGIFSFKFGVKWYWERATAFAKFIPRYATGQIPAPSFAVTPATALFIDDLVR
jgi:hypothetical protein